MIEPQNPTLERKVQSANLLSSNGNSGLCGGFFALFLNEVQQQIH